MGYLPFFSAETWTLLAILVILIIIYGRWPYGVFEKLGIPGPEPSMFWGSLSKAHRIYYVGDLKWTREYGKVFGMYEFRRPMLFISDPAVLKTVLVKECYSHFTNRRNLRLNGDLYDAMSITEDDQWRRIRTVLSPSFTSGRIREMFRIMQHHSGLMVGSLSARAHNDDVIDIKELFGAYSMDVMISCSFSMDIDSLHNPNNPFVTHSKNIFRVNIPLFILLGLFPCLYPVCEWLGVTFWSAKALDFFSGAFRKIRSQHQLSSAQKNRVDFLQLMIDSQKGDNSKGEKNKGLSDHEILSQAIIFVFGGSETSSNTLTLLAYNLATHPHIQTRLQEEIDSAFPNKASVQYEALTQMEYLDCVVSESLRLFPTVPRLERVASHAVEVNGITIPKDTVVAVPVYALHHDPDVWPNPEEFKPERFSRENKAGIDPYTYLPFGTGPRNCIGMRFALIMVKLALVQVLQSYSFVTCKETELPLEFDPQSLLGPLRPIKLKLRARPAPSPAPESDRQIRAHVQ